MQHAPPLRSSATWQVTAATLAALATATCHAALPVQASLQPAPADTSPQGAVPPYEVGAAVALLQPDTARMIMRLTLVDVRFAPGSDNLDAVARGDLDLLARYLTQYRLQTAVFSGHTDSSGVARDNQDLAMRRAEAAQAYIETQGIAHSRVSSESRGEGRPATSNGTTAGRSQNRRVEIRIAGTLEEALPPR